MDQPVTPAKPTLGRIGLVWLVGMVALMLLAWVVGSLNDATELTPYHEEVGSACFIMAVIGALISAGVAIWQSGQLQLYRRAVAAVAFAMIGFIALFLLSFEAADLIEGMIDFPPGKTRSYPALLLIGRAYQTHGKGRSWNIQTTPLWSNLDITEADYDFMLAHRRPGDDGRDPDEISSKGHFCARVTIEQSGEALRVMHAGTHALPQGSVILCPPGTAQPEMPA